MSFKLNFILLWAMVFLSIKTISQENEILDKETKVLEHINYLFNNGESKTAFIEAKKNIKLIKEKNNKAKLNLFFGHYYHSLTKPDSSIYFTTKALKFSSSENDSLHTVFTLEVYNLFALNNRTKGLYHESKRWNLLGLDLSKRNNKIAMYYIHKYGIGRSYMGLKQDELAIDAFKECLNKTNPDSDIKLGAYINLGRIFTSLNKLDISYKYLIEAKAMFEKNINARSLANVMLNLGDNFLSKGEVKKALDTYYEVKNICLNNGYQELNLITLEKIGTLLIDGGETEQAKQIFSEILAKSKFLNLLKRQMNSYKMLEIIYSKENDYKNAYQNNKNYFTIKDSIDNLQKEKEINQLEMKFQTLEKEKAIKLLQVENLNKSLKIKNKDVTIEKFKLQENITLKQNENKILHLKNRGEIRKNEISLLKEKERIKQQEIDKQNLIQLIAIITFAVLLIPVIGLLTNYYQKIQAQRLLLKKEQEVSTQKIASIIKDQKLKLIKASIKGQDKERRKIAQEMHDSIGGNLAAIKLQFSQFNNDPKKMELIYKQIDSTYEQVRDLSHNLIPKKIRESDFVFLLNEHMRSVEEACNLKVDLAFFPEEKLNTMDKELQNNLFAICLELTTNTIKHAQASKIDLQIDLGKDRLFFMYEDNGKGFNTNLITHGIGLSNIKNRIEAVNGKLNIDTYPSRGTIVSIEIPQKQEKNEI